MGGVRSVEWCISGLANSALKTRSRSGFNIFSFKKTKIFVLIFASVEIFGVSHMQDFFFHLPHTLRDSVSPECGISRFPIIICMT